MAIRSNEEARTNLCVGTAWTPVSINWAAKCSLEARAVRFPCLSFIRCSLLATTRRSNLYEIYISPIPLDHFRVPLDMRNSIASTIKMQQSRGLGADSLAFPHKLPKRTHRSGRLRNAPTEAHACKRIAVACKLPHTPKRHEVVGRPPSATTATHKN